MRKQSQRVFLVIATLASASLVGCAVPPQQTVLAGGRSMASQPASNERLIARPVATPPVAPSSVIAKEPEYKGPHLYSVERDGMYGYTEMKNGEVHFFRYDGKTGDTYKLISFVGAYASMITCKADCRFADISSSWGTRTFQVEKGTILGSVITDMLAGALRVSTHN